MTAWKHLAAGVLQNDLAVLLSTYVLESFRHVRILVVRVEDAIADTTFNGDLMADVLLAGLADVIRRHVAQLAEIDFTRGGTPDPV